MKHFLYGANSCAGCGRPAVFYHCIAYIIMPVLKGCYSSSLIYRLLKEAYISV